MTALVVEDPLRNDLGMSRYASVSISLFRSALLALLKR
jgi:hypothetical protein